MLASGLAACGLAGCSGDLIDPEQASRRVAKERVALLKPQPAPRCEYRTASLNDGAKRQTDGQPASGEANPDLMMRTKLDYELQCYKHAEIIARARLTHLQGAFQDKLKADKRNDADSASP